TDLTMARPTKPKDLKPKAEGEAPGPAPGGAAPKGGGGGMDLTLIIALVIAAIISVGGAAGSTYLMTTQVLMPYIDKKIATAGSGEEGAEGEHAAPDAGAETNAVGMNLELDDFMVNLKPDPALGGTQYLKSKIALSIKVPEAENCYAKEHHAMLPALG